MPVPRPFTVYWFPISPIIGEECSVFFFLVFFSFFTRDTLVERRDSTTCGSFACSGARAWWQCRLSVVAHNGVQSFLSVYLFFIFPFFFLSFVHPSISRENMVFTPNSHRNTRRLSCLVWITCEGTGMILWSVWFPTRWKGKLKKKFNCSRLSLRSGNCWQMEIFINTNFSLPPSRSTVL